MQEKAHKILVKFPTRERPFKAIEVVKRYIQYAADNDNILYLISIDKDDKATCNKTVVKVFEALHPNVICVAGESKNKVHAYNRDIELVHSWDILVAASDDMICNRRGWDNEIRKAMRATYPDTDGLLHFNDGYVGSRLNTLPILGRKYYDRFGYVYHKAYISLWCDNEQMEVAQMLKKQKYFATVLFKHEHWSNNGNVKRDALMVKTESYFNVDRRTYIARKRQGFFIKQLKQAKI